MPFLCGRQVAAVSFVVYAFDTVWAIVVSLLSLNRNITTRAEVEVLILAACSHEQLVAALFTLAILNSSLFRAIMHGNIKYIMKISVGVIMLSFPTGLNVNCTYFVYKDDYVAHLDSGRTKISGILLLYLV